MRACVLAMRAKPRAVAPQSLRPCASTEQQWRRIHVTLKHTEEDEGLQAHSPSQP
jgi:hypothetical protein